MRSEHFLSADVIILGAGASDLLQHTLASSDAEGQAISVVTGVVLQGAGVRKNTRVTVLCKGSKICVTVHSAHGTNLQRFCAQPHCCCVYPDQGLLCYKALSV
jgi:hypothetical protein